MRALVLGGSSFVGGRLVQRLLADGDDVTILNRGKSAPAPAGVRTLTADRRDIASMRTALAGTKWDVVYDVSGYIMATDAENFTGLVDILEGNVGRYVYVSSVMAYAQAGLFPWTEDFAQRDEPPTTYGGFKVFAENLLLERHRANGLPATIARPAAIYGPDNNIFDMESAMFLRLRNNLPVLLPHGGLVTGSFGHVDDFVGALRAMATADAAVGEIFNVTGSGITAAAYVQTLAEIVGVTPEVIHVPDDMLDELEKPAFCRLFRARHHGVLSTQKIEDVLGVPPERGFQVGHEQTYEWFLSSPLAGEASNLADPLWGKGFDLQYEEEIVRRLGAMA
ncbi:NAD-dependent epimerase/dehydratase family protein [Gordonia sp. HNM0687]|uniref:NAD-dependent epimerase/dehydratase family protein n=1 Tax=Gordonia mangrovi TaxID=2665643 RepID=A0A6L7GJ80_9ACTN|nr:NAD-dependent epimerase/dehydratase family protein [Gordonia mangrovi]MXP20010.1 NAD-dependent epimerase/dehydratase family protein [Gordonia mangrovi]UVF79374.1 NAD-dependent epimerase/dehydratase family protein [Gordonia mangrovi]